MSAQNTVSAKCPRSFLVACLVYHFLDAAFDLEGVSLPRRKLCFSSANGAMQSNCSMKQKLCSENPTWNSRSRLPSRA